MQGIMLFAAGLLAQFQATAQPQYSHLDTIVGRCERYLYPEWYDECPSYQQDTNGFMGMLFNAHGHHWAFIGETNPRFVAKEYHVSGPIQVEGLVAMVALRDTLSENYPRSAGVPLCFSQERAPEMMILCQGGARRPLPAGILSESHLMLPLDSVRWDTATPYLMQLPLSVNADPDDTLQSVWCYAYEAYFPQPVTVDSVFYVLGTFRSSSTEVYDHPVYGPTYVYTNYPTAYVAVVDHRSEYCARCTTDAVIYDGYLFFDEGFNYGTTSNAMQRRKQSGLFLIIGRRAEED